MKRVLILVTSFVILLIPFVFEPPSGLSQEGFKTLSVFIVGVLWWASQIVPIMITSIFMITLFATLGLADSEEIYSLFGSTSVFFLLGSFILGSALRKTGITQDIALWFIKTFGKNSKKISVSFALASYFLSLWTVSHGVVAILVPIAIELMNCIDSEDNKKLMKSVLFSILWGATLGGSTTPLGGARSPLVMAIVESFYNKEISFLKWIALSFPITVSILVVSILVIIKTTPQVNIKVTFQRGKATDPKEKFTVAVITLTTVFLWIFAGDKLGIANIALGTVVLLFLTNVITWTDVERNVNWGIILMYGGAIVLGKMMNETGVSQWIVDSTGIESLPDSFKIVTIIVIGIVLTEIMSNSAASLILAQLALPLLGKNLSPETMAVLVSMITGFAYILPTGSPSVSILFSTGQVEFRDFLIYGGFMTIMSCVILLVFVGFWTSAQG